MITPHLQARKKMHNKDLCDFFAKNSSGINFHIVENLS